MKFIFALIFAVLAVFATFSDAKSAVCSMAPSSGEDGASCRSYTRLYYYDSKTNQCRTFEYNGCGGNGNKFDTIALCQKACQL